MKRIPGSFGPTSPRWKGGRTKRSGGYIGIYDITSPTKYRFEHVMIAEKTLRKKLPVEAAIHHVDSDKANNKRSNLVICQDRSYHMLLHKRTRALKQTGNAYARRCTFCARWDTFDNPDFVVRLKQKRYEVYTHKSCDAAYHTKRYIPRMKKHSYAQPK